MSKMSCGNSTFDSEITNVSLLPSPHKKRSWFAFSNGRKNPKVADISFRPSETDESSLTENSLPIKRKIPFRNNAIAPVLRDILNISRDNSVSTASEYSEKSPVKRIFDKKKRKLHHENISVHFAEDFHPSPSQTGTPSSVTISPIKKRRYFSNRGKGTSNESNLSPQLSQESLSNSENSMILSFEDKSQVRPFYSKGGRKVSNNSKFVPLTKSDISFEDSAVIHCEEDKINKTTESSIETFNSGNAESIEDGEERIRDCFVSMEDFMVHTSPLIRNINKDVSRTESLVPANTLPLDFNTDLSLIDASPPSYVQDCLQISESSILGDNLESSVVNDKDVSLSDNRCQISEKRRSSRRISKAFQEESFNKQAKPVDQKNESQSSILQDNLLNSQLTDHNTSSFTANDNETHRRSKRISKELREKSFQDQPKRLSKLTSQNVSKADNADLGIIACTETKTATAAVEQTVSHSQLSEKSPRMEDSINITIEKSLRRRPFSTKRKSTINDLPDSESVSPVVSYMSSQDHEGTRAIDPSQMDWNLLRPFSLKKHETTIRNVSYEKSISIQENRTISPSEPLENVRNSRRHFSSKRIANLTVNEPSFSESIFVGDDKSSKSKTQEVESDEERVKRKSSRLSRKVFQRHSFVNGTMPNLTYDESVPQVEEESHASKENNSMESTSESEEQTKSEDEPITNSSKEETQEEIIEYEPDAHHVSHVLDPTLNDTKKRSSISMIKEDNVQMKEASFDNIQGTSQHSSKASKPFQRHSFVNVTIPNLTYDESVAQVEEESHASNENSLMESTSESEKSQEPSETEPDTSTSRDESSLDETKDSAKSHHTLNDTNKRTSLSVVKEDHVQMKEASFDNVQHSSKPFQRHSFVNKTIPNLTYNETIAQVGGESKEDSSLESTSENEKSREQTETEPDSSSSKDGSSLDVTKDSAKSHHTLNDTNKRTSISMIKEDNVQMKEARFDNVQGISQHSSKASKPFQRHSFVKLTIPNLTYDESVAQVEGESYASKEDSSLESTSENEKSREQTETEPETSSSKHESSLDETRDSAMPHHTLNDTNIRESSSVAKEMDVQMKETSFQRGVDVSHHSSRTCTSYNKSSLSSRKSEQVREEILTDELVLSCRPSHSSPKPADFSGDDVATFDVPNSPNVTAIPVCNLSWKEKKWEEFMDSVHREIDDIISRGDAQGRADCDLFELFKPSKTSVTKRKPLVPKERVKRTVYPRPKLYRPDTWANKKLYDFLFFKLRDFELKRMVKAEEVVKLLFKSFQVVVKSSVYQKTTIENLKMELAKLHIIQTTQDFHEFIRTYLPPEFGRKVIPCLQPFTNIVWPPKDSNKRLNEPLLE